MYVIVRRQYHDIQSIDLKVDRVWINLKPVQTMVRNLNPKVKCGYNTTGGEGEWKRILTGGPMPRTKMSEEMQLRPVKPPPMKKKKLFITLATKQTHRPSPKQEEEEREKCSPRT